MATKAFLVEGHQSRLHPLWGKGFADGWFQWYMDRRFDWVAYADVAATLPHRRVRLAVVTAGNDVTDRWEVADIELHLAEFARRYSGWFDISILDVVPPADQTC